MKFPEYINMYIFYLYLHFLLYYYNFFYYCTEAEEATLSMKKVGILVLV